MLMTACGSAQSREARYIQHGKAYFNAGHYDKARIEFSNAAQIDPKDPVVRYLLGQVAEKLGDVRAAVGHYQAAIDEDPRQEGARASLARIYLYAGLPDKAMELVEPGLAADPKNPQLLTVRGAARVQLGDAKQALQDAQAAVHLAPADNYAVALLASLYRRSGDSEHAVAVVSSALQLEPKDADLRVILADLYAADQRPVDAENQLKQIITLQPQVLVNRYRLARFYLQQKNVDAAERVLRDAVGSAPKDVQPKLQLAAFLAAQRSPDQAVAQVEQFITAEPSNDSLRLTLGQFLAQIGQKDRAESEFHAVIAQAGTEPAGLIARDQLAAVLLSKQDRAAANALIEQVLRQNPQDSDALTMRSDIALSNGDASDAIVDLRSVLRDQPNAVGVMRALAQAYQQNGEIDLAEQTLRSAVQVAPKDATSRLALATVLIGAGQASQAEPLLEQLSKEDPSSLKVQQALFQAQTAQKQNEPARSTAQLLERIAPKQALGYYLEGEIDEVEGHYDTAAQQYEHALELEPKAGEPLTALVLLDLNQKRPAAALSLLDKVIATSPADGLPRDLKGQVLIRTNQTAAAIAAFQSAVQTAPEWPRGYSDLGAAQLVAKRPEDAIVTLQQGIARLEGAKGASADSLLSNLGSVYERLGRSQDAIALYQRELAKNPKSVFAANNLAMLLITYRHDSSSLAQAQKIADQLATLSVASVIDTRGWVKFKSGDFHGAESLLQEAVDKSPNAPELRYHLAMAELRGGEPQAARQNLESALQSPQPFTGMDDARATLAQLHKGGASG
jgi:tetratricopeptide (TPR) repeat protein